MEGGCACGHIRYRLYGSPMMVHACHCTCCQRETGTVHALNAMYEFDRVEHLKSEPDIIDTPSASGKGQRIARCPVCKVGSGATIPAQVPQCASCASAPWTTRANVPPVIHIFTSTKQPWVTLPPGAKAFAEFYDINEVWPGEARERRRALRERMKQQG